MTNYGSTLLAITDGTSNTIMVAELRAGISPLDPRGVWAMGFSGSSIANAGRASYNPTPNNTLGDSGGDGGEIQFCNSTIGSKQGMGCINDAGNDMTSGMSRSQHTGGVNCGNADGSVRFLMNSVSQLVWCQLLSKSDGYVLSGDY